MIDVLGTVDLAVLADGAVHGTVDFADTVADDSLVVADEIGIAVPNIVDSADIGGIVGLVGIVQTVEAVDDVETAAAAVVAATEWQPFLPRCVVITGVSLVSPAVEAKSPQNPSQIMKTLAENQEDQGQDTCCFGRSCVSDGYKIEILMIRNF